MSEDYNKESSYVKEKVDLEGPGSVGFSDGAMEATDAGRKIAEKIYSPGDNYYPNGFAFTREDGFRIYYSINNGAYCASTGNVAPSDFIKKKLFGGRNNNTIDIKVVSFNINPINIVTGISFRTEDMEVLEGTLSVDIGLLDSDPTPDQIEHLSDLLFNTTHNEGERSRNICGKTMNYKVAKATDLQKIFRQELQNQMMKLHGSEGNDLFKEFRKLPELMDNILSDDPWFADRGIRLLNARLNLHFGSQQEINDAFRESKVDGIKRQIKIDHDSNIMEMELRVRNKLRKG